MDPSGYANADCFGGKGYFTFFNSAPRSLKDARQGRSRDLLFTLRFC
jgi:hypothetical protein